MQNRPAYLPAIHIENLGKEYCLGATLGGEYALFRDVLVRAFTAPVRAFRSKKRSARTQQCSPRTFWALKDVSLEIRPGEVVGLIGANGAGKSTLLKCISRITEPSEGRIEMNGRVASLLEVGTGFHPELTGRENIFLNGAILGMTRKEIAGKLDSIIAFAELDRFISTPVKRYSSGMYVRLAFAVAAHLEPEILLVDEVLAVGDAAFQKKCLGKMGSYSRSGRTVVLVSHNMAAIQGLCDRVVFLKNGRVAETGEPHRVVGRYLQESFDVARHTALAQRRDRSGSGKIRIVNFHLEDRHGSPVAVLQSGKEYQFVFGYICEANVCEEVEMAFGVKDSLGTFLFRNYTRETGRTIARIVKGGGEFRCRIKRLPLRSGNYSLGFRVTVRGDESDYIQGNAAGFVVEQGDFFGTGIQTDHAPFLIDHTWEHIQKEVSNGM